MTSIRKPAFDAVRVLCPPGVFNDAGNVLAFDNLLDALGAARDSAPPQPVALPPERRRAGPKAEALIRRFEGCELEAYPDPGSGGEPWTIGFGATLIDGKPVRRGQRITQEQADALLLADIARHAVDVAAAIGLAPTTQEQFDALVSFHFNTGAIHRATLTRLHKAGDFSTAARQFALWNKAGGRVLNGLVRRRAEEAALYRSGSPS